MSYPLLAAANASVASVRFMLDADPSPGLLPRLLQPFAKRDLIPDRMWSHRGNDTLHVEIAVWEMPTEVIHLIEGNLRSVVGVRAVNRVAAMSEAKVA